MLDSMPFMAKVVCSAMRRAIVVEIMSPSHFPAFLRFNLTPPAAPAHHVTVLLLVGNSLLFRGNEGVYVRVRPWLR